MLLKTKLAYNFVLYGIIGPNIGAIFVLLVLLLTDSDNSAIQAMDSIFLVMIALLAVAYSFFILPALLTGLVSVFYCSKQIDGYLLIGLTGALSSMLMMILLGQKNYFISFSTDLYLSGSAGLFAGLVMTWVRNRMIKA